MWMNATSATVELSVSGYASYRRTFTVVSMNADQPVAPDQGRLQKNYIELGSIAMVSPVGLHFALASTRFPWQVIVPLLLLGAMLASNSMLSKAIGDTTDDSSQR